MTPPPIITSADPGPAPARATLREAAQGFEAYLVRRMLEAARAGGSAGALTSGPGVSQFTALRDEHLADIAAQRGTFGIAAALEAQLARHVPATKEGGAD
ncbi:rod-binding protein [Porphyrobacter sp. GA68]|uniref:rod-binding protein n=1 Tax=Porphyrobacter sp. GA68 TaxID=2883480 RepID=UPI001D194BB9|nr:rod-binding protein [Porphyrobacter sp. GA68]